MPVRPGVGAQVRPISTAIHSAERLSLTFQLRGTDASGNPTMHHASRSAALCYTQIGETQSAQFPAPLTSPQSLNRYSIFQEAAVMLHFINLMVKNITITQLYCFIVLTFDNVDNHFIAKLLLSRFFCLIKVIFSANSVNEKCVCVSVWVRNTKVLTH